MYANILRYMRLFFIPSNSKTSALPVASRLAPTTGPHSLVISLRALEYLAPHMHIIPRLSFAPPLENHGATTATSREAHGNYKYERFSSMYDTVTHNLTKIEAVESQHFRVWPHEIGSLFMLGIGDDCGG